MSIRLQALLIFLIGLSLFTLNLSSQEIIGFESRFYLFVLEMWRHGASWFPTTYQEPYPDYPVGATLMSYLFSKGFGSLNKFTVIFPSAAASALTLSITYLIGALRDVRWGLCAVLFLLLTMAFVMEARSISLDQYTTAITALCFYLIYSAQLLNKPQRVYWVFPLFVVGFMFRGPIGLVIPTAVVCVFYLLEKEYKRFFKIGFAAFILLILCCAFLLLLAYQAGGMDFLQSVIRMEVVQRMQDTQTIPFYFYALESFGAYALTYPLAILVMAGIFFSRQTLVEKKCLLMLCAWVLIVLVGMSVPANKKIRYILPIAPALALICGYLFINDRSFYFRLLKQATRIVCVFLPLIFLSALYILWQYHLDWSLSMTGLIFLAIMQCLCFIFWRHDVKTLFLAAITFIFSYIIFVEPINQYLQQTRVFVEHVERLRHAAGAKLVFYREGTDAMVIKYVINMPIESKPLFVMEWKDIPLQSYVVTKEEYLSADMRILLRGNIGREAVVVFSKDAAHR